MMKDGRGTYFEGLCAESMVADLLREEGFVILSQNYRLNHLEVDLIALDGTTVCFVEVKARAAEYLLQDVDALIGAKKRRNLTIAADYYINTHPEFQHYQVRFDYALVHTPVGKEPRVRYIKSAFVPGIEG